MNNIERRTTDRCPPPASRVRLRSPLIRRCNRLFFKHFLILSAPTGALACTFARHQCDIRAAWPIEGPADSVALSPRDIRNLAPGEKRALQPFHEARGPLRHELALLIERDHVIAVVE